MVVVVSRHLQRDIFTQVDEEEEEEDDDDNEEDKEDKKENQQGGRGGQPRPPATGYFYSGRVGAISLQQDN